MVDREKVIKGLELCREGRCHSGCPYNHINVGCRKRLDTDAIDLLKEQPEIVQCKYCAFRDPRDGMCEHVQQMRDPDWYCADGVRRDDDA